MSSASQENMKTAGCPHVSNHNMNTVANCLRDLINVSFLRADNLSD
jgi:hypothetical protein